MVQDVISEKLGNFIYYMATFVSGFVVGFTAVWQLSLVTLAVVRLIAVIGAIHQITLSRLSAKKLFHRPEILRSRELVKFGWLTRGLEETVARWDEIGSNTRDKTERSAAGNNSIGHIGDEWDEEYDR